MSIGQAIQYLKELNDLLLDKWVCLKGLDVKE